MLHVRGTRTVALISAGLFALVAGAPGNALVYVSTVFASGLDNPRGLAFDGGGNLWVAEGGHFVAGGPQTPTAEGLATFGETGALTRIAGGVQTRVHTGLPSLAVASGTTTGPADVAFFGGVGYFLTGLGANPLVRATDLGSAPAAANLASLYSFDGVSVTKVADIGLNEVLNNPAGDQIDSNPFHLTAGPNGLLVADAGGNALLNITAGGAISTVGVFPDGAGGIDAVPTGVSVGPDGAFYVGQLTGFPFVPNTAEIFRIDPITLDKTVFASGFTNITDIAWGPDGELYVLQFADAGILNGPPGSIRRVNGDGTTTLIFGGLIAPTGLEIGSDGSFYVTNFSPLASIGQVLRITAVP